MTSRGRSPRPRRAEVAGEIRTMSTELEPSRDAAGRRSRVARRRGAGPRPGGIAEGHRRRSSSSPRARASSTRSITRKGDKLSLAERILTEIGKEHGFEVVASKDGRLFDPDKIGQWDAFAFETTGDLTTAGRPTRRPADVAPTARRPSSTPSAAARASSACTAPPTPSATRTRQGRRGPLHPDDRRRVRPPRRRSRRSRSRSSTRVPRRRQGFGGRVVRDQRRVVRPEEPGRRPARHPRPGHRGDEGQRCTTGPTSPRPGPGCTARAASSTPRWATAKTSGRTRSTRACCSAPSAGRPGKVEASVEPNVSKVTPEYNKLQHLT